MRLLIPLFITLFVCSCGDGTKVKISNTTNIQREFESIEIPWDSIKTKLPDAKADNIIVKSFWGCEIPSQIIYNGTSNPTSILFQVNLNSKSSKTVKLCYSKQKTEYTNQTFGRFVPERYDDFTWESNKMAYRMYGPALEATGEISNGIDVWLKRTDSLIINKWYTKGYDYHNDSGEGLDCYKVGRTLGAGAMAPIANSQIVFGNNYVSHKILDQGALRIKFCLEYAPFKVGKTEVTETRIITLDANKNLNQITEVFDGNFASMDAVIGIVKRNKPSEIIDTTPNSISLAEAPDSVNGTTYLTVITKDKTSHYNEINHILKPATIVKGEPYTYLAGAYWSKSGIENQQAWINKISEETIKFNNPIIIEYE